MIFPSMVIVLGLVANKAVIFGFTLFWGMNHLYKMFEFPPKIIYEELKSKTSI